MSRRALRARSAPSEPAPEQSAPIEQVPGHFDSTGGGHAGSAVATTEAVIDSAPELTAKAVATGPDTFTLDLPPEPDWTRTSESDDDAPAPTIGRMTTPRSDGWRTIEALPPQLRPTPARTGTPAVWIMVWLPLLHSITTAVLLVSDRQLLRVLADPAAQLDDPVLLLLGSAPIIMAVGVLFPLVTLLLAFADRASLRAQRMPRTAAPWWTLLHPLVYLGIRTAHVMRYTGQGYAPLVVWVIINVLLTVPVPFVVLLLFM